MRMLKVQTKQTKWLTVERASNVYFMKKAVSKNAF